MEGHLKQAQEDHDLLTRIDERTKTLVSDLKSMRESLAPTFIDFENRIRNLEKTRWTWGGMITVISAGIGWIFNYLSK